MPGPGERTIVFVIARSVVTKQSQNGQPVNEAGLKLGLLNKNVSNNSSLEKSNLGESGIKLDT
jgi:hypothetical protein